MILVRSSESKFPVEYIFERNWIGCEWDILHVRSSNYPQTAGKKNIFMHNCVELFSAPDDMKVNQGFTEHAIPWFLEHAIPCLLGVGVWRRTLCNPTHGPSGVLGESLECPCDPSSWLWVPKCTFHAQNSNFMNRSANFKWIADLSPQYQHNIYIYTVQ